MVEPNNSRESSARTVESKGKENKEQNHCQDDSDEHNTDNGEKKRKGDKKDISIINSEIVAKFDKNLPITSIFKRLFLFISVNVVPDTCIHILLAVNKQKWVPLEIDLVKNRGKRERSPKYSQHQRERNGEGKRNNTMIVCFS